MDSIKEKLISLLEEDKEFRLAVAGLLGYKDILDRLEEHDKKFNEIIEQIRGLREDFNRLAMRVEVTIGSMGRRWGRDLEKMVLNLFKEMLEEKGIEPRKVEKYSYIDRDGSLTGVKGRKLELDVFVHDRRLYFIEVKSHAEFEDVEWFLEKAKWLEKLKGRPEKLILVTVNIDDDALKRAKELEIDVLYGNVIEL